MGYAYIMGHSYHYFAVSFWGHTLQTLREIIIFNDISFAENKERFGKGI